ncbi:MAG TPA: nitroreductase family deazaflavin-dependent oxidoreductase [Streptosporangiaceae bacterium]|nr:nitroreductase family deazaflavin-dependent oxidoreductase [Streptosporangiaceae bacterium]
MTDMDDFNTNIIREFRENGGKVGGPFEGAAVLILHTTGAKSGAVRENPVMYKDLGGSYAVFASKGGAPTNPAWYHNLLAHPEVQAEIGTQTVPLRARVAGPGEREEIWVPWKTANPGFAEYEASTSRQIPVVILEPAS